MKQTKNRTENQPGNQVKKEMLTGFRRPTIREKERIEPILQKKNRGYLLATGFWKGFCIVLAAGILLGLLTAGGNRPLPELAILVVFFIGMVYAIIALRAGQRRIRQFLERLANGDFQVMDCWSYVEDFNLDSVGMAVVKIHNEAGQYCSDWFPLEREIVRICKRNRATKLLLLKDISGTYELFIGVSENRAE